MILVTVGTGVLGFNDLMKAVDNLGDKYDFFVQYGHSKYKPTKVKERIAFIDPLKFPSVRKKADLVITHGAAASLFESMSLGKKIVGVANPHVMDDHQRDLLSKLAEDNYLVYCKDLSKLDSCIQKVLKNKVKLKKYNPPKCTIGKEVEKFIDAL